MSGPSLCTLVLIAVVSCYALSSTKALQYEQTGQQATQKVDLANRINAMPRSQPSLRMESRRKRDYKELNDIIDELGEATGSSNGNGNSIGIGITRKASTASETAKPQDYDLDNMPALTYYLLLQKLRQLQSAEPTYRVRTPRLGRSIDFPRLFDSSGPGEGHPSSSSSQPQSLSQSQRNEREQQAVSFAAAGDENEESFGAGVPRQFVARLIKKSVPFKPRLGKRAQVCGNSGDD